MWREYPYLPVSLAEILLSNRPCFRSSQHLGEVSVLILRRTGWLYLALFRVIIFRYMLYHTRHCPLHLEEEAYSLSNLLRRTNEKERRQKSSLFLCLKGDFSLLCLLLLEEKRERGPRLLCLRQWSLRFLLLPLLERRRRRRISRLLIAPASTEILDLSSSSSFLSCLFLHWNC
jgi:hypothetical protein